VFLATHDLTAVVDALVEEMITGAPVPLPDDELVGGAVVHGNALPRE
jgi:hypothetical protein